MTDIRQQNQIGQFLKNQGKEFQSIELQQPKVQFGISEIDRNGQVKVKRGFRFDDYSKAEEVITKLPAGQYQIQKIYIVD